MLKKAQEVIASGDMASIVDFGIELDRSIKAETKELETIKDFLRGVGKTSLASRSTTKTVEIQGNLGMVSVTYPADAPHVRKGVDLLASEAGIPAGAFNALFRKKVVVDLVDGFLEKLRKLEASDREMIENLIVIEPATPRVSWPR